MNFKFHIGRKKTTITTMVVLSLIVASISSCIKIEEKHLWDIIYEYLQTHDSDSPLIPELQKDPGIVERDVERSVSKAISEATDEYDRIIAEADKKYKPRYIEGEIDTSVCYTEECKSLSPPMRICSPWITDCVNKNENITE